MKRANEICPTTAKGKAENGALFVDVRSRTELDQVTFDVPHCLEIPLQELEERWREIPKDRDIVLVCLSGERSLRATYYLMNAGYQQVYNMREGLLKWVANGFPVKGDVASLESTSSCDCSKPNCC